MLRTQRCNWQDFGQHGREFVSSETSLRLLGLLADEAELRRFCSRQGIELEPLQRALQHTLLEASLRSGPPFARQASRVSDRVTLPAHLTLADEGRLRGAAAS